MKRILIGLLFLAGVYLAFAQYKPGAAGPQTSPDVALALAQDTPKDSKKDNQDAANKAILANVKTFTDAFNKKDAKAILALFTEDCELAEVDGTVTHGLKELEEELKDDFATEPKAQISVSVDSLRLITPDVAIEDGKTTFYPDGKTLTAETEYQATHVKKGDRWLMAQVRSFNRTILSPYDSLRDLEWLVGEWIDESPDSLVESTYRWDEKKSFLLQDFTIRVKGKNVLKGTQRIGWDPLTKQIKAWVFDSEGGQAETSWTPVDGSWVIKGKGVRFDGTVVSYTSQLTQLTKERLKLETLDRIVGDERMPAVVMFAVRRPPPVQR